MPVRRKVFRIEEMQLAGTRPGAAAEAAAVPPQHILAELAALRGLIEGRRESAPKTKIDTDSVDACDIEANGLRQLKNETDSIHRAITRTKQEIAALHVNGLNRPESGRMFRELGAVVGGQERAIQQVLAAAEDIDEAANTLSAAVKREQEQALAQDIRDQVIRIFEACNFQDLAGQRITTVLATLKFIEDRIARMMEIWGGIEAFKDYTAAALAEREPGPILLNGPKLEGDQGHASQDEIDALFRDP
jgi:chemotaxis protein CheZ